jgi:hypothetical protein
MLRKLRNYIQPQRKSGLAIDAKCENAKFWAATPSGQLWMQINNPDAFGQLSSGHEYFVDFTAAVEQ